MASGKEILGSTKHVRNKPYNIDADIKGLCYMRNAMFKEGNIKVGMLFQRRIIETIKKRRELTVIIPWIEAINKEGLARFFS